MLDERVSTQAGTLSQPTRPRGPAEERLPGHSVSTVRPSRPRPGSLHSTLALSMGLGLGVVAAWSMCPEGTHPPSQGECGIPAPS